MTVRCNYVRKQTSNGLNSCFKSKYFLDFYNKRSLKLFINMQYLLSILCATECLSVPDLSFVTFPGFRYISVAYNSPSAANSVILVIYCCRFCNLYVNKSQLFFKLVPKKQFFVSVLVFEYRKEK
jgi:hypothetical protein